MEARGRRSVAFAAVVCVEGIRWEDEVIFATTQLSQKQESSRARGWTGRRDMSEVDGEARRRQ